MITAKEALELQKAQLLDREEMIAFERLRASIIETIKIEFSGIPFHIDLPLSFGSAKIVYALKRDFEDVGADDSIRWSVVVSSFLDAKELTGHRLSFYQVRSEKGGTSQVSVSAPREMFLETLHDELTTLRAGASLPFVELSSTPVLSVLFGTFERKACLKQVVASIRRSVGEFSYEIVVCDGGSKDGSREWLAAQRDVVLVGDRHLTGAVGAFNNCYRMARGEFIANLNDDCIVEDKALRDGICYLQANGDVGQVAFGFRGPTEDWHINDVYPSERYPQVTWPTTYANFGITRRTVANRVAAITGGFWNPIYRTYAADCELSAWIQKLGWRIAKLCHLHITDTRAEDGLRAQNANLSGAEAKRMYLRWPADAFRPNGPNPNVSSEEIQRFFESRVGSESLLSSDLLLDVVRMVGWPMAEEERHLRAVGIGLRDLDPVEDRLPKRAPSIPPERVLHLHINGEKAEDQQHGLVRALRKLGSDGYTMVRWPDHSRETRREHVLSEVAKLKPTIIFMQLQAPDIIDPETVQEARSIVNDPNLVVLSWNGDIASDNSLWGRDGESNLDWQVPLGRVCDLTLHSSMTHVWALRAAGIHSAGYLQIGFDEEQYCPGPANHNYDYDVCFLGSRYGGEEDEFSRSMKRHDGALRDQVIDALVQALGSKFGLFGRGFTPPRNVISVNRAHEVYRSSKMGLNVSLANFMECYTSDRLLRILGCGTALLTKAFPGMSTYGLRDGKNCLVWETPGEAVELAQSFTRAGTEGSELSEIAWAGKRLAHENHTWDVRMLELIPYLTLVREIRAQA